MRCGTAARRWSSTTWCCALIDSPCDFLSPARSRLRANARSHNEPGTGPGSLRGGYGDGNGRGRQLPSGQACSTIRRPSGRSSAWQSARFGTVRPVVQIHSPRPFSPSRPPPRKAPHPTFRARFSRIDGRSELGPVEHFLVAPDANCLCYVAGRAILLGPPGVGKTALAVGLGIRSPQLVQTNPVKLSNSKPAVTRRPRFRGIDSHSRRVESATL